MPGVKVNVAYVVVAAQSEAPSVRCWGDAHAATAAFHESIHENSSAPSGCELVHARRPVTRGASRQRLPLRTPAPTCMHSPEQPAAQPENTRGGGGGGVPLSCMAAIPAMMAEWPAATLAARRCTLRSSAKLAARTCAPAAPMPTPARRVIGPLRDTPVLRRLSCTCSQIRSSGRRT